MTEKGLREFYVECAKGFIGTVMGDDRHKEIVDTYNSINPLPRGYKLSYTDSYCMAFCSAVAVLCGMEAIFPVECGCGEAQAKAVSMGIWQEDDGYVPNIGDLVLFDWTDSGTGDCHGWPQHVAVVESVDEARQRITLVNPNSGLSHGVGESVILINGRNIRGYILPHYAALADPEGRIGEAMTSLYVRTGPGIKYPPCNIELQDGLGVRNILYAGEKVCIIDELGGWYKIRCKGLRYTWEPWCSARWIKT